MVQREKQMWRVLIAAPIETVWNTLVQTDVVLPFLFGGICQTDGGLSVGRPMRMVSKDGRNVIAFGEVLELNPPLRFSHSINFAMAADELPGRTTYDLREVAGGTELTLTSEALPGTQTAKMAKSGQFIVDNLKSVVETARPTFGGRMIMFLSPFVSVLTPRRCRQDKWPLSRIPVDSMEAGQ